MELPGLANLKRNTLRGIASLTERPSKNKAERSEAITLGGGFPRPKGQAAEDGGAGTTPSETAAAAKCPITRYVNRALRPGASPRATAWRRRAQARRRSPVRITSDWTTERRVASVVFEIGPSASANDAPNIALLEKKGFQ